MTDPGHATEPLVGLSGLLALVLVGEERVRKKKAGRASNGYP